LGNGRGDFSEASSVELEREVSDVAVVELGADAFPDVVALHGAAAAVSLLRGGGDGTLAMDSQLAVGRAPSSAATADLDGDGTQELLVVEEDDNAVSVYVIPDEPILELPISHWCPVRPFPYGSSSLPPVPPLAEVETGGAVLAPAVGDFDGDGRRDVALALPAQGVRLVLNPGGGTFTTRDVLQGYVLGSSYGAGGVLAADFNRDGYVDLAASFQGWCVGRAARYTNQGDGTFRATGLTDYNFEPDDRCPRVGAPLAGDFNGDGTLDLLHDTLGLNLNPTAADGSTLPGYGFGGGGANLGLSDVDGDGRVDLVQRDHSSGGVWLHVGDGHGSLKFPIQCTPPVGDKTLALEDLDGDGVVDVAGTSSNGTELWVSLGEREGTWGSPRRYAPGGLVEWVKPVDLLGDERPEFLVLLRSGRLLVVPTPES
ncbi:MAG TPA: VCBS repeat-containing protein, partial [Archangium sp.]|nr:VCBS repeat-containing protein [Archangium sp.]